MQRIAIEMAKEEERLFGPTRDEAQRYFDDGEYALARETCEPMLRASPESRGHLGGIALESAFRLEEYRYVKEYWREFGGMSNANSRLRLAVVALKIGDPETAWKEVDAKFLDRLSLFCDQRELETKINRPASNSDLEFQLFLNLAFSINTRDEAGRILFLHCASRIRPKSVLPYLMEGDMLLRGKAEDAFAKAWPLASDDVRAYIERTADKRKLDLKRITDPKSVK